MESVKMLVTRDPGTEDIELPAYQSDGASGMDVRAAVDEDITLHPGDIKLIPSGLRLAVPVGYEVQVRPRSGLALKHGLTVPNTPGTIDADYRGPVGIILGNVSREPFTISRGDRIAQLVVQKVIHAKVEIVEDLDATARGDGGFGSSGIN
ncbi:MAG: dUTP diphosphatase [Planctomycetes bacterium]|nr:dUTP diphosphatase [Planctomycetota bacterium]